MTFEDWEEELEVNSCSEVYNMYADWKAEREKLVRVLKPFAYAANETDNNKNIDENTIVWKPTSNFRKTYGITVGDLLQARVVLAEAREQG